MNNHYRNINTNGC